MSNGFLAGFNKLFGAGKSKEARNKKQQEQAVAAAAAANGDNNNGVPKTVESPPGSQPNPQHNRSPSGAASSLSPSHASSSASGSASSSASSKLPVSPVAVLERLPSISGEEGRQAAPTAKPLSKTPSQSSNSSNPSSSASIAASAAAASVAAAANQQHEPALPSASSSAANSRRTSGHMQSLLSPSHASGSSSNSSSPRPSPSDHSPLSQATPADSSGARAVSQPAADAANPSDAKFTSGVSRSNQKRAISDPLANLLASISSHLPIKEKDQPMCPKAEGYAVLDDTKHIFEDDPTQLETRMGSDVGIHRQSDSSAPSSSNSSSHHHHHHHQHTHSQGKKAPLGLTHLVPSFPSSSTVCTDDCCCVVGSSSSSISTSSSSSLSTSTSSSASDKSSSNTTAAIAIQDLLKKMQYSSIDTMLSAGGATMPASVRTHLEKKLIAYKLANHHASVAAQQHQETAPTTTTSAGTALQRSHTTGTTDATSAAAAAHCTPSSAFFSLKSLFQPSSSPQQYAPFQPPVAAAASDSSPSPHLPPMSGVPPSIPLSSSSSALAASSPSPSPSFSFTPASSAQQRLASRSLSRDSTETTPRREGEPEVSSPLSPSLKSASPLVSGASLAEIDGHWSSTHASRRIKKVSKKPSFALSSSGGSNPSLSSLDEFVHVNPSSPLSGSSSNVSRSIPGGAAPDFSLLTNNPPSVVSSAAVAGLGSGEWKRIDDISETDRKTLERGLSKLEAHSSSRSASLGSGTILAPHSALAQLQLEHASSATSTPSPPILTANPSVATPVSTTPAGSNAVTTPPTNGSLSLLPTSPAEWSVSDVQRFLHSLGLQEHAPRFERSTIDGEMLITLSEEDLTELGVSDRFHRRKLLKKLNSLLPSKEPAETNGDVQTRPTSASASAVSGSGSRSNPKSGSSGSASRSNKKSGGRSASTAQADSSTAFSAASSTASSSSSIASSGSARRRRTSSSDDDDTDDDVEEGEDVAPLMRRGGAGAKVLESTQQLLEDYDTSDVDSIYVSREQVERMLRHLQLRSYRSKNKKNKKAMSDFNGNNKDAITAAVVGASSSSSSSSSSKPSHKHSESSKASLGSSRTLHASVKKKNKNRSRDPESTASPTTPVDPYHAWQAEESSAPSVFNNPRQSSQSLSQHGGANNNNGIQSLVSSSANVGAAASPAHHLSIISLNDIHSLRHLNEGTAGVAYVGRYDNKNVVVKQPKKKVIGSEEWLELQLHMSIPTHPNVIPFIGICMVQVQMYLVTEFIERGSLKSLLSLPAEQGGTELRRYYSHPLQLIRAAAEIGQGLQHLHEHHIVHRDVAARNILVTAEGQHILSDFGLSRWMEKRERNALRNGAVSEAKEQLDPADETEFEDVYTMHSLTALPARWTSPESLRSQSFNAASDVYSLGLVMFEMLTGGQLPYNQVKDNLQVIAGIVTNELQLQFPKDASPEVIAFIRRAMEPVETRPSMQQLLSEMEQFIKNQMELYNQQFLAQQQQQQPQQQVESAQVKQVEVQQEPVVFQQNGDLFANLEQLQPLVINEKSSH